MPLYASFPRSPKTKSPTREIEGARMGQCCSYVNAGLALSVLKGTPTRSRLRQRLASRPALSLRTLAFANVTSSGGPLRQNDVVGSVHRCVVGAVIWALLVAGCGGGRGWTAVDRAAVD